MPTETLLLGLRVSYSSHRDRVVLRGEAGSVVHMVSERSALDTGIIATTRANYIQIHGRDAEIVEVPGHWRIDIDVMAARERQEQEALSTRVTRDDARGIIMPPPRNMTAAMWTATPIQPPSPHPPLEEVATRSGQQIGISIKQEGDTNITLELKLPRIKLVYRAGIAITLNEHTEARLRAMKRARLECFKYMQQWLRTEFERHKAELPGVVVEPSSLGENQPVRMTLSDTGMATLGMDFQLPNGAAIDFSRLVGHPPRINEDQHER